MENKEPIPCGDCKLCEAVTDCREVAARISWTVARKLAAKGQFNMKVWKRGKELRRQGMMEALSKMPAGYVAFFHEGCGKPAFFVEENHMYEFLNKGKPLTYDKALTMEGEHPKPGSQVQCSSCGGFIQNVSDVSVRNKQGNQIMLGIK